jgi:hypothetical protein
MEAGSALKARRLRNADQPASCMLFARWFFTNVNPG